jgi:carbamoyl-phosphate synthase small subunit
MPEIGNVGVNEQDMESSKAHAKGMIVRKYQDRYSNFRATDSLKNFLLEHNVMGICDIDTRFLTKMIRSEGAMMMVASTLVSDKDELKKILENSPRIEDVNYIEQVSTKVAYKHENSTYGKVAFEYDKAPKSEAKIAVIDFGVKRNILNELVNAKIEVEVIPNDFDANELIEKYNKKEIDGVFLSNGPGDPLVLKKEQEQIKKLIGAKIPMFGICLGHQLLSISHGYDTFKLKFGHHGGNHPVKNEKTGFVEITAQNHNYNVPDDITDIAEVTHINLFDNTIEGLRYNDAPIFSVQHHPEASPGPKESSYIFSEFLSLIKR